MSPRCFVAPQRTRPDAVDNPDVIKTADWVIDLGPEGGDGGGQIIATGTPEDIAANKASFTGEYLKPLVAAQASARSA